MKRTVITIATLSVLFFTLAASAGQTNLFKKYESVRQALLSGSVEELHRTTQELADTAVAEKQNAIAERANALASVANLEAARDSFSMLSEELIRFRKGRSGSRPVVVYCSMEKKSWLQPKGAITNPYVDASMRSCGEVQRDRTAPAPPSQNRHH